MQSNRKPTLGLKVEFKRLQVSEATIDDHGEGIRLGARVNVVRLNDNSKKSEDE